MSINEAKELLSYHSGRNGNINNPKYIGIPGKNKIYQGDKIPILLWRF